MPGVAPAAMQMGHARGRGTSSTPSPAARASPSATSTRARSPRSAAARASPTSGRLKFSGYLAWLPGCFVHIFFLIGFRNRFLVLIQWAWSYFTYDRGARLITAKPDPARPTTPIDVHRLKHNDPGVPAIMAEMPTLFFDLGGVLLTNGWDTGARSARPRRSGSTTPSSRPGTRCSRRPSRPAGSASTHYIRKAVFHRPRPFTARRIQGVHVRPVAAPGRHPRLRPRPGGDGQVPPLHPEQRVARAARAPRPGASASTRSSGASSPPATSARSSPTRTSTSTPWASPAADPDHAVFIDDRAAERRAGQSRWA